MSDNEIKPVAWRVTQGKTFVDRAFMDNGQADISAESRRDGAVVAPLYDQSAIDAINKKINELKTMLSIAEFQRKEMQAERDGYASAADFLELEMAKFQIAADEARAERDAAVADAERYRWLRKHLVNWCPDYDEESLIWHAREALDAEIDAARAEGK